jgi:hypothetical protein
MTEAEKIEAVGYAFSEGFVRVLYEAYHREHKANLRMERAIHDLCKRVEEMEAELDMAAAEEAK